MRFASPEMLWLLLAVPLLALVGWWSHARRARALRRFAGGAANVGRFSGDVSQNRRAIKMLLLYLALIAASIALARPQWGTRLEEVTRRGSDIVIVLDTSLSMLTEDLAPNRLEQAKHTVGSLLDQLGGDRVALITFAGQAQVNCPLTVDHGAVRLFLEAVDVNTATVPGTALGQALQGALDLLLHGEREGEDRGSAVIVLSDGEDHAGELDAVLDELEQHSVAVYSVGCGTARGAPIPLRDSDGVLTGYKKDREGKVVTSRLSEDVLESLALRTGGRYYQSTTSEVEVEQISGALSSLAQAELGSEMRTRFEERFQFPLLLAWIALIAESLLGDRRRLRPASDEEAGR